MYMHVYVCLIMHAVEVHGTTEVTTELTEHSAEYHTETAGRELNNRIVAKDPLQESSVTTVNVTAARTTSEAMTTSTACSSALELTDSRETMEPDTSESAMVESRGAEEGVGDDEGCEGVELGERDGEKALQSGQGDEGATDDKSSTEEEVQ